ncbi:MAG: Fis family transcriptional regulator [Nitrospinae bacterium CG11_big_fil_rev_8_21_14_0_20_56_8]|nr:MAG: Fis family transcriptional regulator [Nitrospinae bacterium CG11_big_fil_rev_8_21_14_0_20_56_8]
MQKADRKVHSFLEKWLQRTVKGYVGHMDGTQNGHLFETIVSGVEKPLLEIVLNEVGGNKTQAANILGINRNTLRKKLQDYKIRLDA